MSIFFFAKVKGELIINGEIIITRSFAGISMIMIGGVTFLAMISRQPFCATKALSSLAVTKARLCITLALLATSTVHRISPISRLTLITIGSIGQILTRLLAVASVRTSTVSITLASWTVREMPVIGRTLCFILWPRISTSEAFAETSH